MMAQNNPLPVDAGALGAPCAVELDKAKNVVILFY